MGAWGSTRDFSLETPLYPVFPLEAKRRRRKIFTYRHTAILGLGSGPPDFGVEGSRWVAGVVGASRSINIDENRFQSGDQIDAAGHT